LAHGFIYHLSKLCQCFNVSIFEYSSWISVNMKLNLPKANCDLINKYEKPLKSTGGFSTHGTRLIILICFPVAIVLVLGGVMMTIFNIAGTNDS
jgi:hypothetical protein